MTIHARTDAIDRLTDVDGNLIEVAKHVAADVVSQRTNGPRRKGRSIAISLLRGDELRRLAVNEHRLKNMLGDMPHDRHADAIAADMVGVVIARQEAHNRRLTS